MKNPGKIVERIRAGLAAKGMRQTDLARLLDISKQSIGQMLEGRTTGAKHYEAIAGHLGCTVEWLVSGTGRPPTWHVDSEDPRDAELRELRAINARLEAELADSRKLLSDAMQRIPIPRHPAKPRE
jgi:transcriptional regulator with XRE-family HTH domain